jgi:hypothetical protein
MLPSNGRHNNGMQRTPNEQLFHARLAPMGSLCAPLMPGVMRLVQTANSGQSTMQSTMFDQKTIEEIKFYVYALFDPDQPRVPFYIGKGKGNRVFSHAQGVNLDQLEETTLSLKREKIAEILRRSRKVRHTIIQYELTEEQSLRVESALIDMVNHILPETLANLISGIGAAENFIDAGDLATEKCATPLDAKEPLLLIKTRGTGASCSNGMAASATYLLMKYMKQHVPIGELMSAARKGPLWCCLLLEDWSEGYLWRTNGRTLPKVKNSSLARM